MPTLVKNFRCDYVSATESGDYFQVFFGQDPDSDEEYVLVQRQFEMPDGGACYVEIEDVDWCGQKRPAA